MLPGNTFLHKILPTPEWRRGDLWGSLLQKTSPGVAQPVEFIREFGSKARNPPVTFLVEFKKDKHWGRERPMGRGEGERVRVDWVFHSQSLRWGFLADDFLRADESRGGGEHRERGRGGVESGSSLVPGGALDFGWYHRAALP